MIPGSMRLAVLLSGSGRTLENLAKEVRRGRLDAEIAGVLSSRSDAYGLVRAKRLRIPARVVRPRDFPDRLAFWSAAWKAVDAWEPDLVVMAGWMCYLRIPKRYQGKVLNIHPSLLPKFGGKGCYGDRVHEAVIAAKAKTSGCTVHVVDNEYDHGPILARSRVKVLKGDSPHALAARVFKAECRLYPAVLQRIAKRFTRP